VAPNLVRDICKVWKISELLTGSVLPGIVFDELAFGVADGIPRIQLRPGEVSSEAMWSSVGVSKKGLPEWFENPFKIKVRLIIIWMTDKVNIQSHDAHRICPRKITQRTTCASPPLTKSPTSSLMACAAMPIVRA